MWLDDFCRGSEKQVETQVEKPGRESPFAFQARGQFLKHTVCVFDGDPIFTGGKCRVTASFSRRAFCLFLAASSLF